MEDKFLGYTVSFTAVKVKYIRDIWVGQVARERENNIFKFLNVAKRSLKLCFGKHN